jgi:chromosome segregation ATPase
LVVSSIGSTRAKIGEILGHKSQLQEARIQEKLEKLNQQISADRLRVVELQDAIVGVREQIQRDRQLLDTGLPDEDSLARDEEREEQNLLLAKANALAEENQFRADFHRELEKLKSDLGETQMKIGLWKQQIRESKAGETGDLQKALKELERLEEKRERLLGQKDGPQERAEGISRERKKQRDLVGQVDSSRRALSDALVERDRLLNELRRLDFMLFGRSGKWQGKQKVKPVRHIDIIV